MLRLAIDRFEGETAVLTTDDGRQVDFPRNMLPSDCKAGDLLTVTIQRDVAGTADLAAETRAVEKRLKAKDAGGDIKL